MKNTKAGTFLIILVFLIAAMAVTLFGCSGSSGAGERESTAPEPSDTIVIYFSWNDNVKLDAVSGASVDSDGQDRGNAAVIAYYAAEVTSADMYSIRTKEIYPEDYDEVAARARSEAASEDNWPELLESEIDISPYSTAVIVAPVWFGELPPPVKAFIKANDFSGKRVIPIVTSGSSGNETCVSQIKEYAAGADVADGIVVDDSEAAGSRVKISGYLSGFGYEDPGEGSDADDDHDEADHLH